MIEALLNFLVGHKHPSAEQYRKVFTANAVNPVEFFVAKYKPYENSRYPLTVGQYHGRKDEITPLLFFKPDQPVERWFPAPATNKIKAGRPRLFLNYAVLFERLGIAVAPGILPIAYIEAVINYSQAASVSRETANTKHLLRRAG
jgi:hypothetical protein